MSSLLMITNNNIHIQDSFKYSKYTMRLVLQAYKDQFKDYDVFKRGITSMVLEWATHNMLYNLNIQRERTKDVDLDYPQKWYYKVGYSICGVVALMFIK